MSVPVIAIIGGGFSGTSLLLQLSKQAKQPLKIVLINKDYPVSKGVAYNTSNPKHVLNVPAAKMSIFPDDPDDFLNWVKSKDEYIEYVDEDLNDRFLPRVMYGRYLKERFDDAISDLPSDVSVEIIEDEAIDINLKKAGAEILLKNSKPVYADKTVLALGNFPPDNPPLKDKSFYNSAKYFANPWLKETSQGLEENDSVLIIGTGLTMVDNVISLLDNGFKGKVFAVSTKGFFPLSHKKRKPYTDILDELNPPYELSSLYKIFRKHIKKVLSKGIPGEAVVDAVRPHTQEIWMSLSLRDKIRFMSHVRHLWGVARHRLPKEIYDQMKELMSCGRLEIIAGRLREMKDNGIKIEVMLQERHSHQLRNIVVQRVINCTGPMTDLSKMDMPLVKNLIAKGLIAPDEMKLGMNALSDGTIIQKDHSISDALFTIGPMLKGILWESTAVPELRVQATVLADLLLNKLEIRENVNV